MDARLNLFGNPVSARVLSMRQRIEHDLEHRGQPHVAYRGARTRPHVIQPVSRPSFV